MDAHDWLPLLTQLRDASEATLALVATHELTGDANGGITETGFKLTLLSTLAPLHQEYEIESERDVEGGRIDLFIRHKATGHILLLELKYVRLGFLAGCQGDPTKWRELHRRWAQMSALMMHKSAGEVRAMRYRKPEGAYDSVETQVQQAFTQLELYRKQLVEGQIRAIPDAPAIAVAVLIGVGKRVLEIGVSNDILGDVGCHKRLIAADLTEQDRYILRKVVLQPDGSYVYQRK